MTEKDNKLIKPIKDKRDEQLEQFRVDMAIPRTYRMMEGFGIHTFRLIIITKQHHVSNGWCCFILLSVVYFHLYKLLL